MEPLVNGDPIFDKVDLTYEEQTYIRGKPKKYLEYTINLFNNYTNAKTIVEVGSIRSKMNHTIAEFNPACCNDGHSTYFWSKFTTADIFTVDIDPNCKKIMSSDERLHRVNATTGDAIEFLKAFTGKIDLLFLDAWDVVSGTPYAEKHVEAYTIVKSKLSEKCLILIDDTDIASGGKGRDLIPILLAEGFTRLSSGRQSLFSRID